MCHGSKARKLATVYTSTKNIYFFQNCDGLFLSCLGELTSVCDDYAEPHDLIRRASLPRCGDRALYSGKKEIDHEECEDDSNRLVLPFSPAQRVSKKAIFVGRERGLRPWPVTHGEEEGSDDDGGQEILKRETYIRLRFDIIQAKTLYLDN